ncbi:MAG: glycosyltransferase family 39 protein, partial [Vicinamibacteraceae bacterium]|nr:glycosyltransferase family 39 protein [Vicinamibacteraceae bacterium]
MALHGRRDAAEVKPETLWLVVTLAVATLLRVWRLDAGLPYQTGADEPQIMVRVLTMMKTGDLNPHFFMYPGLVFYLHLPVAILAYLVGTVRGTWHALAEFGPEHVYLWGRAVTAALGVATVFVTHQIGMRWGARHALLAAGLMAVMPLHVRESHFVLTDVPATFLVALTGWLALRAHEDEGWLAFAAAGFTAGLAAAMKYNAGVALVLPLVAVWLTWPVRPSRGAAAGGIIAAAFAGFLAGAPYTLIDLPAFLNDYGLLMRQFVARPDHLESGWLVYLKHLRLAYGWPSMILLGVGTVMGLVRAARGPGRARWTLVVALPLVYLWLIADRLFIYGRYLLPLLPFTSVLTAAAVISGVALLRRFHIPHLARRALITALTIAALLPPLWASVRFLEQRSRPTTHALAYEWITTHVPAGSVIVVEGQELALPARYGVSYPAFLDELTPAAIAEQRIAFIVASSAVHERALGLADAPRRARAYAEVLAATREVARFEPGDGREGPTLR